MIYIDLLTGFAIGSVLWTAAHFLPKKKTHDDLILDVWKQVGLTNKDGLLPVKKKDVWFLPAGLTPRDVEKTIPALEYQLNAKIELETKGKAIILHQFPGLPTRMPYKAIDLSTYGLGLVLGKTTRHDPLVIDLNDSSPYILVAGGVGMGKSNFLNLVLRQITENYTPEQVQYFLIDLKLGVELGKWADSPMCAGTCWDPATDQLQAQLSYLTRETKRRMKTFKKEGVYKIDEYNKLLDVESLPYLLLVVDEYAELRRDQEAEAKLQSLLQIGRAAGLRVIISTQRPTHDNISTSIKGLIPTRLCFSVADRVNSDVVLDQGGAEGLGGIPGRALLLAGAAVREVQIMASS